MDGAYLFWAERWAPGRRSVRSILLLLLALLLVLLIGVQTLVYVGRYEQRRSTEYQANLEVARAVAAAFDAFVDDLLHQELATGRALVLASGSLSEHEAHELLAAGAREYPALSFCSWLSPDGHIRASSQPDVAGVDLSDRAYVRAIVDGQAWAVSDLLQDPLSGEAAFVVARGIRDAGGEVTVRVGREGETATIEVTDEGVGIPAADCPWCSSPIGADETWAARTAWAWASPALSGWSPCTVGRSRSGARRATAAPSRSGCPSPRPRRASDPTEAHAPRSER